MPTDLDQLTALNRDYVASVQNCDVRRFDEILAPEFYCSNPDKSLVDRAAFLEQTAKPVAIKNLQAHDVKIRIMGHFAIIHLDRTVQHELAGVRIVALERHPSRSMVRMLRWKRARTTQWYVGRIFQDYPETDHGPRPLDAERCLGARRYQPSLLLRQRGVEVQHERISIRAKLGHNERNTLGHQA